MRSKGDNRVGAAFSLGAAALFISAALTAGAAAAKNLTVGPNSTDAILVVEVEAYNPLADQPDYDIGIGPYDPAQGRIGDAGAITIHVETPSIRRTRYVVARARPGTYALWGLSHEGTWLACFNGGTVAFTLQPGTVNFLGRLDSRATLAELSAKTPHSAARGSHYVLFDTLRPGLTPVTDLADWSAPLAAYLATAHPNITAPLRATDLSPAVFATGQMRFGGRRCY